MEEFERDVAEEVLNKMTPEQLLKRLTAKQIMEILPHKQLLSQLPIEEIEKFLEERKNGGAPPDNGGKT
jgi:hypothetical protein